MNEAIRDLLDESIEIMFRAIHTEDTLGVALMAADDATRTEIAYYLLDTIMQHPHIPPGRTVRLAKIEQYIGHLIGVAEWQVGHDALADDAAELNEFEHELLEALHDLDDE